MRHRIARPGLTVLALAVAAGLSGSAQIGQPNRTVNDKTLVAPPVQEWVSYGRDYAETHHSPLRQIDATNVGGLGLAWSVDVGSAGKVETTPLVWNGVLYGTSTWSVAYAIEARTGRLKWKWDPDITRGGPMGPRHCCGPVNRGVALYDGKVFVGLLDGRLVALDAESGKVVWSVQTTPRGSDYTITGAPRVVKGKVLIGNGGAEYGVRGYLTAYHASNGAQAWRFYTVPGDPSKPFEDAAMERAAKTWTGEWWRYGGGGTPWDGIAYDPEADLLYVGTGNGSPWNHNHRSPGGGDNLFLSSIVALKPDTGAYVWHYQTTPGDNWDYNAAQPMVLANLTINGALRKVIMQAPKNGFFYVLDRLTGEFISAQPFVKVTWASGIDPKTGRPIETPEARYGPKGALLSPSAVGAHHWPPMAWNPATGLVYFPGQQNSMTFRMEEAFTFESGRWNTGVTLGARAAEATATAPSEAQVVAARPRGFFLAWDPVAQKERWRITAAPSGGMLTTAGGLVFAGEATGRFMALNAETGAVLWEQQLLPGIATPMTYELDGRQYVSVMSGQNNGKVFTFALGQKSSEAAGSGQVVRTADPTKRGLKESDFPRTIKLAENVYSYEDLRSAGDERFTTVSLFVITTEGVLVADGQGHVDATKRLVDAIAKLTTQPIKYVVICSDHGDHTAGNSAFPAAATFIAHPTSQKIFQTQASAPSRKPDAPPVRVPTEAVADRRTLKLGGTEIEILFLGRAHTGGDLSVHLPRERILFMSEAYLNRVFPAMRSAYPSEWVAAVDLALKMNVRTYVPGHGFTEQPDVSREELVEFRKALDLVIATVSKLHKAGVSADEAVTRVEWGPYAEWRLSASQGAIAVRKIYEELDGKLKD